MHQLFRYKWLLAFVAGAIGPLAFAPFDYFAAIIVSMLLWFYLIATTTTTKQSAIVSFAYGVGYFGIGISWVYVAIHEIGRSHIAVAALLTLLFVAYLSLFPLIIGWLYGYIRTKFRLLVSDYRLTILILPLLVIIIEWLRGWLFTGFPWLAFGYAALDTPMDGWAALIGVYGLSGLIALMVATLYWMLLQRSRVGYMVALGVMLVIWLGGGLLQQINWATATGEPISVAIVQGSIDQQSRWQKSTLYERITTYQQLSEPYIGANRLIVWPENAIPAFYENLQPFYQPLADRIEGQNSTLITGGLRKSSDGEGYHTSLTVVGEPEQSYHKRHLVPFGEYLPLEQLLRGVIAFFNLPMSGFTPGPDQQQLITAVDGVAMAPSICYEDLFASDISDMVQQSHLMINLSNNGWYGDSFAPHQHLQIARMRSLEFARPTIRSTTSGISALINADGTVQKQSLQFVPDVITGQVQPVIGMTPYLYFGDKTLIGIVMVIFGVVILRLYKKNLIDQG